MRGHHALLLTLVVLARPLQPAPMPPDLQKRLLELYDRYNKTIQAGKLDDALALRSTDIVKELRGDLKTPTDRQGFLDFSQATIPDKIELLHATASKDGTKASLFTIASKKVPPAGFGPGGPPPGSTVRSELKIEFVKENGAWKLAQPNFGPDPGKIPSCASESFDPIGAYEDASSTSLGGLIMRVAFEPQYTLVIVRVVDENNCAYVPNREELPKLGIDPATLTPYATVEIDGRKHKSDPRKIWADNIKVHPEE
ncbi:MAG TPA: hypothetical protein VEU96_10140 [Bryobacteraceae bacterium]|nr:hypothetical protein [Bryobacteraceae bacterium]